MRFRVWAPTATKVEVVLEPDGPSHLLRAEGNGLHSGVVRGVSAGARYRYRLDGGDLHPDPASRFQPEGVHGPSEVVDPRAYTWRNPRPEPPPPEETVIYELHVGTFTPEGTFSSASARLPYLRELGIDTIEIMPVADFPGRWNWGYDPAAFFAPSRAYGAPDDLRALVDEAHGLGLRVILDVVYNHFGPAGAYLPAYAPVFTERHHTPWGPALDFEGQGGGLRRFFLENALMWLDEYRFDGLRLDAIFAIIDDGPNHFLAELAAAAAELPGPPHLLVAEDPRNLRNIVLPPEHGGLGLSAVWADDFHHQVRVRVAGDHKGYYADFTGSTADLARTIRQNWYYTGHHSPNEGGPRGTPAADLPRHRFVYCIQNHDQVGNRPDGGRLHHEIPAASYLAASALLLFVPQTPMLFMGQEWAASTPFLYFTDHEGELGRLVSEGRREEFAAFGFGSDVPDPQDPATFERSVLAWDEVEREPHRSVLACYRDLLRIRRGLRGRPHFLQEAPGGLALQRDGHVLLVAFDAGTELAMPDGARLIWSTEDDEYAGDPSPPRVDGASIRFGRPGAAIAELPS